MSTIYDRLGTLGSPARVRLLRLLELEELQVGEIANVVQMPQSTCSRHLKALLDDGWVARRKEGTSAWFAMSLDLPEDAQSLWEIVQTATDGEHPEDGLRLASVLSAREVDSRAFFGRVGGGWTELRRELYGDGFLLPSLLALLPPGSTFVDLGCGSGDVLSAVAPWVERAIGVDREAAMLELAARQVDEHDNVELRVGALEDPPLEAGEADLALCMLSLHHVEQPSAVMRALAPALSPAGRLVVVDMIEHDRDDYRRSMGHKHLGFSAEDLARLAESAGLGLERYVVLPPSPGATGPALFVAVLGLTGR